MVSNCAHKWFASWTIFSSDGSGMSSSFIDHPGLGAYSIVVQKSS